MLTREQFADMARAARGATGEGGVSVLDELSDGSGYAERHVVDYTGADGTRVREEVCVIGSYAPDGRFASLNEAAFPLPAVPGPARLPGPSGTD